MTLIAEDKWCFRCGKMHPVGISDCINEIERLEFEHKSSNEREALLETMEIFRNFIRSNQLSNRWNDFIKLNPLPENLPCDNNFE